MITIVLGTRPELIKLAPVMRALDRRAIQYTYIHTKQHYDEALDGQISRDLDLRRPDYVLEPPVTTSHALQVSYMMEGIDQIFDSVHPTLVIVQGDTNTVLAASLTASKRNIPIAHVEAGLRSFDRAMPEEINRIVTDHLSDILFAPTQIAAKQITNEGIDTAKIQITGNTVVDILKSHAGNDDLRLLARYGAQSRSYILATLHRQENVDNKKRLAACLKLLDVAAVSWGQRVLYPLHPRTRKRIKEFGLTVPESVRVVDPVSYFEMLALEKNASLIMTDSGGVQEEAYIFKVPLITMRDSTERPETMSANFIIGVDEGKLIDAMMKYKQGHGIWGSELGDGYAGERIVDVLQGRQL